MDEQDKSSRRRKLDPRFQDRWFCGRLLDVGCGPDPVKADGWPKLTEVVPYDVLLGNQDAQFLPEIKDGEFDVVHSSHCLEHLRIPRMALANWLRVLKPGGFIVCTVPDELLYECGKWPSRFNSDHKSSFTLREQPVLMDSVNLAHLLWKLRVDVELIQLLTDKWDVKKFGTDQTLNEAECAIEFVARKPHPQKVF